MTMTEEWSEAALQNWLAEISTVPWQAAAPASEEDRHCAKCGHKIWSVRALATGYGEGCRRRVFRAATVLSASENRSAEKAADLLLDAGLVLLPGHGSKVWRSVSSDGERTYLTTADHCNCPAGLHCKLCYHSVAVAILAA
jgi:hypothetical protein